MTIKDTATDTVIIRISETHIADALARIHSQTGDTATAWNDWTALDEPTRTRLMQACRRELLHHVRIHQIWEQALLAENLAERHHEELDINPAHLEASRGAIFGAPTLACVPADSIDNWYIPVNPLNQNLIPRGTWEEWVSLSVAIAAEEDRRQKDEAAPPTRDPLPNPVPLLDQPGDGTIILMATAADVALAMSGHRSGDSTAGEALANWEALPQEKRSAILQRCRGTAAVMYDWENLLEGTLAQVLSQDTVGNRPPTNRIPAQLHGGGSRLAIRQSGSAQGRYQPHSPRNDSDFAEGEWQEWLELAQTIISHDREDREPQPLNLTFDP